MRFKREPSLLAAGLLLLLAEPALAGDPTQDAAGSKDLPGIARFPDTFILGYRQRDQDRAELPAGPWNAAPGKAGWSRSIALEGRRTRILYLAPPKAGAAEIARHYGETLESLGYQTLFHCAGVKECGTDAAAFYANKTDGEPLTDSHLLQSVYSPGSVKDPQIQVGRLRTPEGESHLFVFTAFQDNYADSEAGNRVAIFVEEVLSRPKEEPLTKVDAARIAQQIADSGHAVLDGIRFQPGEASPRPESKPQIEELARMLGEQPDLSVCIVGHTDNRAGLEPGMDLSRRRADAVVQSLIRDYGVLGERLTAMGVGSLAPVASNATDEGRARNDRIELVPR